MQAQTQYSIFLVNKPGVLAQITDELARAKVNIIALTLMDSMEHGVLRIVCENADLARKVLGSAHDRWTETDVLVLELENRPGSFAKVAQRLAENHINISYAYCTGGAAGGKTTAVFKVADMNKARKVIADMETSAPNKKRVATRKTNSK